MGYCGRQWRGLELLRFTVNDGGSQWTTVDESEVPNSVLSYTVLYNGLTWVTMTDHGSQWATLIYA